MALVPNVVVCETDNAEFLDVYDSTGTYDETDNEGGFGTPNPPSSDVTSAQLEFSFDEIDGEVVIDFVILSGVVQSATKTDQLGNITELDLVDYNISAFPFPSSDPPRFPASFFFPNASTFNDQILTVNYSLVGADFDEEADYTFLLDKAACCCYKKAWTKFAEGKCQEKNPEEITNAIKALSYQFTFGNLVAARETIKRLNKLCKSCGCNC